jgi:glycosyltransferase involved in cell wall biosynthesis
MGQSDTVMGNSFPLVSIVTPVFNEEKYLHECIESVLAQTYTHIDYTIQNNSSTDRTLEIAQEYARRDPRIKVNSNRNFIGSIENHNIAVKAISPNSKYCKLLSGDDWMYPECIARLVDVAERHPSVGIIAAYAINTRGVNWSNLPITVEAFNGRSICRNFLLGLIDYFWVPSSVLYRSSLVSAAQRFFPGTSPAADLEACLNCLRVSDLGFVHQILSFERIHKETTSHKVRELDGYLLDRIRIIKEYGPEFLKCEELEKRTESLLSDYYGSLATAVFNHKDREFWAFHRAKLDELGLSIYGRRLTKALCLKAADLLFNPKETFEKVIRRISANGTSRAE